MNTTNRGQSRFRSAMMIGTALSMFLSSQAFAAADAADEAAEDESSEEGITVTGSRIARRDFVATSPIVTLSNEALVKTGEPNIDRALARMPQFTVINNGALVGPATVNLRGLGSQRNLVLLDGRRMPAANSDGLVDIDSIPASIIGSTEIISGGASAVYGSDAISGVVNFGTRKNFTGLEMNVQAGLTDRSDGRNLQASLLYGTKFGGGRGDILLAASYTERDLIVTSDRPGLVNYNLTGGTTSGLYPNGQFTIQTAAGATATLSQTAVDNVFAQYGFAAGTVSAVNDWLINDGGSIVSRKNGTNLHNIMLGSLPGYIVRNGTLVTPAAGRGFSLLQGQKRYNLFGKGSYELTDNIKMFFQGIYSKSINNSDNWVPLAQAQNNLTIPYSNPFIPADLKALMQPTDKLFFQKAMYEFPNKHTDYRTTLYQVLGGLEGSLGTNNLRWNIYYSHSQTKITEEIDAIRKSKFQAILTNPATAGGGVCSTYNPFGYIDSANSLTDACRNYLLTNTHSDTKTAQDVIEGNLNGTLFSLMGNDVGFSLTGTWRKDSVSVEPDAFWLPTTNDYIGQSSRGAFPKASVSVKEIAGEILIPLLRDKPLAHSLEINLGGRYSDYSTIGSVKSYRAEVNYSPVEALMFRGGYERAVRAASLNESLAPAAQDTLFYPSTVPTSGDPCDPNVNYFKNHPNKATLQALCKAVGVTGGVPQSVYDNSTPISGNAFPLRTSNSNLKPETADTLTAGVVFAPRSGALQGLSVTIDWYKIKLKDMITTLSPRTIVFSCYNVDGFSNPSLSATNPYCSSIKRNAQGAIIDLVVQPQNASGITTSGIDFQLNYANTIGNDFRVRMNAYGSYLIDYIFQPVPGAPKTNYAGKLRDPIFGFLGLSHPKFRSTLSVGVGKGPFDIDFEWRHFSGMEETLFVNKVPAYNIYDLTGSVKVNERFTLNWGINNLFDKNVDKIVGTTYGVTGSPLTTIYDVIGRRYFIGAKANF